jgi:hypothetical protein
MRKQQMKKLARRVLRRLISAAFWLRNIQITPGAIGKFLSIEPAW